MKLDLNAIVCKLTEDGVEIEFLDHYAHCNNCHYVGDVLDPGFSECRPWREYKYGMRLVGPETLMNQLIEKTYEHVLMQEIIAENKHLSHLLPKSGEDKNV